MKNVVRMALVAMALVFSLEAGAQDFPKLDTSPMDVAAFPSSYKVSEKVARIIYGRPKLGDRDAMNLMLKDGPVWRTGANEAPEITFYKDVKFGGADVKAGTYALLTMPGESEWTIILHNGLNQWGSYFYDKDSDVIRVKATASTDSKSLDAFSMAFIEVEGGAHLVMGWGTIRVAVPVM